MNSSDQTQEMYRDPDEQRQIVVETTLAIEHNPNCAASYFHRGNAHSNLQNYDQAKQDLSRVIEL